MRLDSDVPSPLNKLAHVFVDGTEHPDVFIADEEEGYVVRYKRDENGNLMTNADCTAARTETVFGKVEIKFPAGDSLIGTGAVK